MTEPFSIYGAPLNQDRRTIFYFEDQGGEVRAIEDFADERHKAWCLSCCQALAGNVVNRDHVPSKVLLDRPFPDNLPVVQVCAACNNGHSLDEEYFIAFLGVVLSGSTKPQDQTIDRARAVLEHNPGLAARIETTRSSIEEGDKSRLYWHPEAERIHRVILKNARGHVYYDFGEPMLGAPSSLWAVPLVSLSDERREHFEAVLDQTGESLAGWPEVGSRAMNRLFSGVDMIDGWTIVQEGIYRYAVIQDGTGYVVRILIREYLAAEVAWSG